MRPCLLTCWDTQLRPVWASGAHPEPWSTEPAARRKRPTRNVSQIKINCRGWALVPFKTTLWGRLISAVTCVCCFKFQIALKFDLVSAPNFSFRCGLSRADNSYTLSLTLSQLSCKQVWYEKKKMQKGNLIPTPTLGWLLSCSIVSQGMLSATTLM